MKGLVPVADPAQTREDLPEVTGVGSLVHEGVGVVVPRQEAYAGQSIDYPSHQQNILHYIRVPRHSASRALDKPEDSALEQVGKPPIFGRPHHRRAFTINFKTLSIDQWPAEQGGVGKRIYDHAIALARGLQQTLGETANIEVPSSVPAGSLRAVPGESTIALDDLYVR